MEGRVSDESNNPLSLNNRIQLYAFLQNYRDGISVVNENGYIILWNHALEAFSGIKASEIIGTEVWDLEFRLLPSSQRTTASFRQIKKRLKSFIETGESEFNNKFLEREYQHPDGRKLTVTGSVSSIRTDRGFILVQVLQDVTERKNDEMALRESEQKFRGVIEQDNDGIFLLDEQGGLIEWNIALEKLTGISREEALSFNLLEAVSSATMPEGFTDPANKEIIRQIVVLFNARTAGEWPQVIEQEFVALDQSRHVVQLRVFPIQQAGRTMLCGVVREITEQKRIEQAARRYSYQFDTLRKVGLELAAELSLDTLLWMIAPRAVELVDGSAMALYIHNAAQDKLELAICLGDPHPPIEQNASRGQGLAGKVWDLGEPVLLEDFHTGHTGSLNGSSWGKVIGAPIFYGGEFLGVIFVFSDRPFNTTDLTLLGLFASHSGAAIRNARLHAELHELAIRDPLTGIFNRRHFFDLSERSFSQARRYKRPLSAIIFDLDHFKVINDTYGHLIGDSVLHDLAQQCTHEMRQIDIFGRYGGEEFAILMPETEIAGALTLAERLRSSIARTSFQTEQGEMHVTISIGIARLKRSTTNLMNLLSEADKALFRAKNEGRNRICV
jgi:diguanylate cyclase (GGDEF)-like protein/PAS domain S-box-containing protein